MRGHSVNANTKMNARTQGYEAPEATVVLFGPDEVAYTDSEDRTEGGHFGGNPLDIPDEPDE